MDTTRKIEHPTSNIEHRVGAASRAASRQNTQTGPPRLGGPTGFTLVELLVVITIIGILAALITTAAIGALKNASRTRIKAELNQIAGGFDEYKNKTTAYPPNCQTDEKGPLDEATVLNDLKRHMRQAFPRNQESDDLLRALIDQTVSNTTDFPRRLNGGMTAGEAVVFWLGGFSSDPKYPISGEGGPAYAITAKGATANRTLDPIESRKWVYPFDVSRLGERDTDGYFSGTSERYIEYRDPKGQWRRINFWQYVPAKSDQPYLYFDTSRHPVGIVNSSGKLLGTYDPPAATVTSKIGADIYAFKKAADAASTTGSTPAIQFINPDKFQVIHCGITNAWDTGIYARMSPELISNKNSNVASDYLLYPDGPFIGEGAETIVNFNTETKIEDSQK